MQFLVSLGLMVLVVVQIVCFIMVVMKMFQMGSSTIGILTLVAMFCGVGFFIAFVWGWIKSGANPALRKTIIAWTVVVVLSILMAGLGFGTGSITIPQL